MGRCCDCKIYRGITAAGITKGAAGNVTRYKPGTTEASSFTDSVISEHSTILTGKKVSYFKDGDNLYILSVEKTEVAVVVDFRLKSGNTQVEAQTVTVQLETTTASAWSDKIALIAQDVLTAIRVKSGDGQIEGSVVSTRVLAAGTAAWTDQLPLVTKSVLTDMRIKSGNGQIEAQAVDALILKAGSAAWSDKIPLTACT